MPEQPETPETPQEDERPLTGSDICVKAMEGFGDSEPLDTMVIWVSEDGTLKYISNIDSRLRMIGILETTKTHIITSGGEAC